MLLGRAVMTSSNSANNVFAAHVSGRYITTNPGRHITGIPHVIDIYGTSK
jgi:hypothetical protein